MKIFGKYKIGKTTGKKKGKPVETKICRKKPKDVKDYIWAACGKSYIPKNQLVPKTVIDFNNLTNYMSYINIDYDSYSYDYNCNVYGCDNGGICRCREIIGSVMVEEEGLLKAFIKSVLQILKPQKFLYCDKLKDFKQTLDAIQPNGLLHYAVDRLARRHKAYDKNNYTVEVIGGYYGDEIGNTTFDNFDSFKHELKSVLSKSYHEGVLELLSLEYDTKHTHVDRLIREGCRFKEKTVNAEDLQAGTLLNNERMVKHADKYMDYESDLPIGVYRKVNDKYVIIDGYHRYYGLTHPKKVKIIVL